MDGVSGVIEAADAVSRFAEWVAPAVEWAQSNWLLLVLTGEIVGAVAAVKLRSYRRGLCWLAAALATIWIGGVA